LVLTCINVAGEIIYNQPKTKTMKPLNLIITVLLCTLFNTTNAQEALGSQVVHHYALDTKGMDEIILQLPENTYEIRHTGSQRLLINLNIATNASSEKAVQVLIKQGRYNITATKDNMTKKMSINSNINEGVIFINGRELKEEIKYIVYIPKHMIYKSAFELPKEGAMADSK